MSGSHRGADAAGKRRALDAAEADGFTRTSGSSVVDRVLYSVRIATRATAGDADRKRYRGTALDTGFETHLARVYGLSWLVCVAVIPGAALSPRRPCRGYCGDRRLDRRAFAGPDRVAVARARCRRRRRPHRVPREARRCGSVGSTSGGSRRRRTDRIDTDPPARGRYLELLAAGSDGPGKWSRRPPRTTRTAGPPPRWKALNAARLAGSLDEDCVGSPATRPRRLLAPFLLKFPQRGDWRRGARGVPRTESRMLAHRDRWAASAPGDSWSFSRTVRRRVGVAGAARHRGDRAPDRRPRAAPPVDTPVGVVPDAGGRPLRRRRLFSLLSASSVRRARSARSARRTSARATTCRRSPQNLASAGRNPSSAAVVCAPPAALLAVRLAFAGYLSSTSRCSRTRRSRFRRRRRGRRTRIDDAKDRELADFVHAVSGHVAQGQPFPAAVEARARRGPRRARRRRGPSRSRSGRRPRRGCGEYTRRCETRGDGASAQSPGVRAAAIDQFVHRRVGTPLAEGTLGLVTDALNAGSDADAVFETSDRGRPALQRAARAPLVDAPYVAVGWAAAALVAAVVAVSSRR